MERGRPHHVNPLEVQNVPTNIKEMNEHQLKDTLRSIYDRECEVYGKERNSALVKGYFISGDILGRVLDLTRIQLPDGSPLLSNASENGGNENVANPTPEFMEALTLISMYGQRKKYDYYDKFPREREADKLDILSEISDITYNLMCMSFDDKGNADEYIKWVGWMSKAMGYTANTELYMLAASKYNSRIMSGLGKDFAEERNTIRKLIVSQSGKKNKDDRGPVIVMPSDEQLSNVWEIIHDIGLKQVPNRISEIPIEQKYSTYILGNN